MGDGREVPGRLYEALIDESQQMALGCHHLTTGEHIFATCPISDAELQAYRRYPDTFFGEVRQPSRRRDTLVDFRDFFYETYKDTPQETALEWLAGAPDHEQLETLSQKDLAITLCERWAWTAFNKEGGTEAS